MKLTPDYSDLGLVSIVGNMLYRPKFDREPSLVLKNFLDMKPDDLVLKFRKFVAETPMFKSMRQPPDLIYEDNLFRLVLPPFMSLHVLGAPVKPYSLLSFFEFLGIPSDPTRKPGLALFNGSPEISVFSSLSDMTTNRVTSFGIGKPSIAQSDYDLLEAYNAEGKKIAEEEGEEFVADEMESNVTLVFREHRAERSLQPSIAIGDIKDFIDPFRKSAVTRSLNKMLRSLAEQLNLPEKSLVAQDGEIQRGTNVQDSLRITLSPALAKFIDASQAAVDIDLSRKPMTDINVISYSEDGSHRYEVDNLFPLLALTPGRNVNAYLDGYGPATLLGLWESQGGTPNENPYVLLKEPSGQLEMTFLDDRYQRLVPSTMMDVSLIVSVRDAR